METSMTTTVAPETEPAKDFDSFYHELERGILALITDDEEDCVETKQSTTTWISRQRFIGDQQTENYVYCKLDFANHTRLVPIWVPTVRRYARNGTGVFIPRTIDTPGVPNTRDSGFSAIRYRGKGRR